MTGIPTECVICNAELLNPHEITGLCRECKLVLRNMRMSGQSQSHTTDEQFASEALQHRCGLCGAQPGQLCRNTVQPGHPLPGRAVHYYRITPTPERNTPA